MSHKYIAHLYNVQILELLIMHIYTFLWEKQSDFGGLEEGWLLMKIYKDSLLFAPLDPQNGVILVFKIKLVSSHATFIHPPSMRIVPHTWINFLPKRPFSGFDHYHNTYFKFSHPLRWQNLSWEIFNFLSQCCSNTFNILEGFFRYRMNEM